MVQKSCLLFCQISRNLVEFNIKPSNRYKYFIDKLRLNVRGGSGGNGLPQYNGIGGQGGNIYLKGCKSINSLKQILIKHPDRRIKAASGEHSSRSRLIGKAGQDFVVECPLGITVMNDNGMLFGELNEDDDQVCVALGGNGGQMNNNYLGSKGQIQSITLDLKLLADVGFIGFPNAGKSTLLKAVSRASPKIANYPFTTLNPNIGTIEYDDLRKITASDLPGLVEGAHKNIGLGHKFLKHIVRNRLLLFIIDINGFQMQMNSVYRSPLETLLLLNKEIELYDETILTKPAILVINKMDTKDSKENYKKFLDDYQSLYMKENEINDRENKLLLNIDETLLPKKLIKFDEIIAISARNTFNIKKLRKRIRSILDFHDELKRENEQLPNTFLDLLKRERESIDEDSLTILM